MLTRKEAVQEMIDRGAEDLDRAILAYASGELSPEQFVLKVENLIDSEIVAHQQRSQEPEGLNDFYGDSGVA